ncbi:MAG: peptidase hydrogen uptake protein [Solirubrobacterales bacterium]|jgi:hydrogenase maturation protease|nr:peptidase hydrogen uptake protein [Solirubrobacterales bacterium]
MDPAFLHDERLYLQHGRAELHVMERHRDHLVQDIEHARELADRIGIHVPLEAERAERKRLALIGVGNQFRRDDAAGLEVARRLRQADPPGVMIAEQEGEPASLLEAWSGADEALVIDGVSSDAKPGTLHRFEVGKDPLPAELFRPSTHALGIAEAVELARELGRLPRRLAVYGIEGREFSSGEGLSKPVQLTVDRLVAELYEELGGT